MSGWDSRLEKGPDGQKCRTCIYRAANRYGPWGCDYADIRGRTKLADYPDADQARGLSGRGAGDAGGQTLHLLPEGTKGAEAGGADPAAKEGRPADRQAAAESGLDAAEGQGKALRRAAGTLRQGLDGQPDRAARGREARDDPEMAAAERMAAERKATRVRLQGWPGERAGPSLEHHRHYM